MKMYLTTLKCPSCDHTFFKEDFNHSCPRGKWYSACLCDCGRVIDGNEVHFCPLDDKPIRYTKTNPGQGVGCKFYITNNHHSLFGWLLFGSFIMVFLLTLVVFLVKH